MIPPVVTPMHADGSLDLASLDRLVDHLIDGGMDGLFVLGSSGQVAYLTDEERDAVTARVVERTAGRVPVVVGTPDMSARRVVEQGRRAAAMGAAAIVVTAPVYALNDAAEIGDHFRIVAEQVSVPVIAYDVPVRVRTKLTVDTMMDLALEGHICAVKDSSGDDVAFRRLVAANQAAGHPIDVLSGHEVMLDGMFLLGGDGAVPGLANVDPAAYGRLWQAAQQGDWAAAKTEQDRIARLFEIAFVPQGLSGDAGGIGAFKAALALLGVIESGAMPAPLRALDPAAIDQIGAILASVGLDPVSVG
jgi:4-hydroxy-tetrahydrodipicolinate synthase